MIESIWRTLQPPEFPDDEDKSRTARLLNLVLLVIFAAVLFRFIAILVIDAFQPRPGDIALTATACALVGGLLILMRRGWVQLAVWLLCLGLWGMSTVATIAFGGVRAPVFSGYLIVITVAGLLLGGKAVLRFAILTVFTGLVILAIDLKGLLPDLPHTPMDEWMLLTLTLVVTSVLLYLAARSMEAELRRSHTQAQKLRDSEQRLILAVEGSNIGLWDWDLRADQIYFSPEWKQQLGYRDDELENRFEAWQGRLHPDDHDRVVALVQRYLEDSQQPFETEYRLRHREGSYRWILARAMLHRDEQGKPIRMIGSHLDISERKRAEETLRQSEEHFSKIFHASPIPIMITTLKDGCYIDANAAFTEISGFSPEEVIGHTAQELNTWVNHDERSAFVEEMRKYGRVHGRETRIRTKSGQVRDILYSGEPINLAGEPCLLSMLYDITERKRAEDRFSKIFHASPIATVVSSARDGRYIDVNESFLTQSGYAKDEVIGHSGLELKLWVHPEHRAVIGERLGKEGRVLHFESQFRKKSGEEVNTLLSLEMIDLAGEPCVLSMSYDITERIRAEKALLEAEVLRVELRKQRELNQVRTGLVSMLSHEFRTPLTVVLTSSQMLQAYADRISPEKKSEYLNNIETQAGRLNGMIDDMLTINRADMGSEPFDPIRIDLNAFSRAIVDEMQQTTILHRIVFSSLTRMEGFNADDKLLRQALTNLISNAIKYSPRGGTIAFSILQVDDRVLIRVSDDGIGIPEADQTELFEMFRRASNVGTIQGTGLGLAIVKRAVERHHGTVSVESAVGKGTVFTLSFPAEGAPLYSGFH